MVPYRDRESYNAYMRRYRREQREHKPARKPDGAALSEPV